MRNFKVTSETIEAAAEAAYIAWQDECGLKDAPAWPRAEAATRGLWLAVARAALNVALERQTSITEVIRQEGA